MYTVFFHILLAYPLHLQRWVDIAITSLTLGMCSRTWLQSSAPPYPPPPQLRVCCYSSTQLSVHKTLTHIHNSGFIACLQANRSLSNTLSRDSIVVLYSYLWLSYCICFLLLDSTELALKAAGAALRWHLSCVSFFFYKFFFLLFHKLI